MASSALFRLRRLEEAARSLGRRVFTITAHEAADDEASIDVERARLIEEEGMTSHDRLVVVRITYI
jgi:hypothetical protein